MSDSASAKVTAEHATGNSLYATVYTEVSAWCDSEGCGYVEFELTWGKNSRREFTVGGPQGEDVRAIARVLAATVGTCLADEAPEED